MTSTFSVASAVPPLLFAKKRMVGWPSPTQMVADVALPPAGIESDFFSPFPWT